MRTLIGILMVCLHCQGCSRAAGARDADRDLVRRLWERFAETESKSQHVMALSEAAEEAHGKDMAFLGPLIPENYPEPYLPHGLLSDARIDPPLGRSPFINDDLVALGKKLFFDERLAFSERTSSYGGLSCSSCHHEDRAFTDGRSLGLGVDGAKTHRNAPTLLNAAYNSTLTWANPIFPLLEMQAKIPLFGDDPVEMGLRGREFDVLGKLGEDREYRELMERAFGFAYPSDLVSGRIDYKVITFALAAFERSLIRFDTRFDRFLQGGLAPDEAFTPSELRGLKLFYGMEALASGTTLACSFCHAGLLLTDSFHYVREGTYYNNKAFHNTGVYNTDGLGSYPSPNHGFASAAQLAADPRLMGQFRTPPLRFVGLTAPYGHDGSFASIDAIILHYAAGGRASLGTFGQNPYVDPKVKAGFAIEPEEAAALKDFLLTLQ